MTVLVRPYTLNDFEQLLDVQKEAFPPPFPAELWWNKEQIAAHVRTFPEGAMAAECDGIIVGSATSLLVRYTGNPHTWEEVADRGYIRNSHDPDGDTLYGIDVCVKPTFRGRGIAQALYEARKDLVVRLGLKRFAAGCRIPGFRAYSDKMSCEQYVSEVLEGLLHDPVLTFMLKMGLRPLQILDHYLEDDESCDKAVLVEWANPEFR